MVNSADSRGFSLCLILRSSILPRIGRLRGHFFLPIYRMLSPPHRRFGQKSQTARPAFPSVSWPFPSFFPGSTISPRSAAVEPLRLIQCYFNKTFLCAQAFFSNIRLYTVLFLKNFCGIYVTPTFCWDIFLYLVVFPTEKYIFLRCKKGPRNSVPGARTFGVGSVHTALQDRLIFNISESGHESKFCRIFNGFMPLFCHQKLFTHQPKVHTILRKFVAECIRLTGLSRNPYYKYKRELRAQRCSS